MPPRFLLDEHLRGPLWGAIRRHNRAGADLIDATRVGDSPDLPLGSADPAILVWAEAEGRIVISRDASTMPAFFAGHLRAGRHAPGLFLVRRRTRLIEVVDFLALVATLSDDADWRDFSCFIP